MRAAVQLAGRASLSRLRLAPGGRSAGATQTQQRRFLKVVSAAGNTQNAESAGALVSWVESHGGRADGVVRATLQTQAAPAPGACGTGYPRLPEADPFRRPPPRSELRT